MQLKKRRKSRGASKLEAEAVAAAAVYSSETSSISEVAPSGSNDDSKSKEDAKESDSDDSDADGPMSDISDSELDVDNYYFLQVQNFEILMPISQTNFLFVSRFQPGNGEPYSASLA